MKEEISILYEDANCLVINKPAGLAVHGDGKSGEYTLADWLLGRNPELSEVGEDIETEIKGVKRTIKKPGIVHRLDKDTTGVMLIAKSSEAYEFFKKQFQDREVQKVYHAFVYGWIKEDNFSIDKPIGRSPGDIRRWMSGRGARGTTREAHTDVAIIKRFGDRVYEGKGSTEDGTYSFIEARPKTGRTHQIRVHLRSINHPIVSDTLYAPKRLQALGFARTALHARELTVVLPSGEKQTFIAPYPKDFDEALLVA